MVVIEIVAGVAIGFVAAGGILWWYFRIHPPKFLVYTEKANHYRPGDLILIADEVCQVYDVVNPNLLVVRRHRAKGSNAWP